MLLSRRRHLAFCVQQFGRRYAVRAGLTEFPLNLISCCAELLDRPTHSSSEFRQFLRAEQKQHDEKMTIMSGPIRFMILAIVIGIKTSPICSFRKVEQHSTHSYRCSGFLFPSSYVRHCTTY